MSSSRSKRKRSEGESADTPFPAPSRRRSRELRTGVEPTNSNNNCLTSVSSIIDKPAKEDDQTNNKIELSLCDKDASDVIKDRPKSDRRRRESNDNFTLTTSTSESNRDLTKSSEKRKINAMVKDKGASRKSRIKSSLLHRRLLLQRVQQGRNAVRNRIQFLRAEKKSMKPLLTATKEVVDKKNHDIDGSPHIVAKEKELPSAGRTLDSDEEEIASFQTLAKQILQSAKKQRTDAVDGSMEKRSSVSLRRGSSVGKRMTAALSSLAPGGTAMSNPTDVSSQPQHLPKVTSATTSRIPNISNPPASSTLSKPLAVTSSSRVKSCSGQIMNQNSKQTAKGMAGQYNDSLKMNRCTSGKNNKSAANSRMSSTIITGSSSQPLHLGMLSPGLPPNRLAHTGSVCREGVALRERRNEVCTKLVNLIDERGNKNKTFRKQNQAPKSFLSIASENMPYLSADANFRMSSKLKEIRGPGVGLYLPRRRKTHWDHLLEEMRWMATDFIEERKWKIASARTYGLAALSERKDVVMAKAVSLVPSQKSESITETLDTSKARTTQGKKMTTPEKSEKYSALIRRYEQLSKEDTIAVRGIAKMISSMGSETAVNTLSVTNEPHFRAKRQQIFRSSLKKKREEAYDGSSTDATGKNNVALKINEEQNETGDDGECTTEFQSRSNDSVRDKQKYSFDRISRCIDSAVEKAIKSTSECQKTEEQENYVGSLSPKQVRTVEFVEALWSKIGSAGAIISGPRYSGKTYAICKLLWKRRLDGPQLLICHPHRVMRWIHELDALDGFSVKNLGFVHGNSNFFLNEKPNLLSHQSEVFVCEYSSLVRTEKSYFSRFETIVVDCRYPQGASEPELSSKKQRVNQKAKICLNNNTTKWSKIPVELRSASWWGVLINYIVSKVPVRRILIEHNTDGFSSFLALSKNRNCLDIFAFRTAFILGPQFFQSSNVSIQKSVLSWARRRLNCFNKKKKIDVEKVVNFLSDIAGPFDARIRGRKNEEIPESGTVTFRTECRYCKMFTPQRKAYDACCSAVRGPLSRILVPDVDFGIYFFESVSKALMNLRVQCIHEDVHSLISDSLIRGRLENYPVSLRSNSSHVNDFCLENNANLLKKVRDSPSQVDIELAIKIIKGSSKFRELVAILKYEYNCQLAGEDILKNILQPSDIQRKQKVTKAKKIVILATLPEAQILASVLLNSLGIKHSLLLYSPKPSFSNNKNDSIGSNSEEEEMLATSLWVECQQALSQFNSAKQEFQGSLDILIASPVTVSGNHGGIGIHTANCVICLDEDWSGRGELLMRSLVSGSVERSNGNKEDFRFIRLVCASTCEEILLSDEIGGSCTDLSEKTDSELDVWPWPLDTTGQYFLPNDYAELTVLPPNSTKRGLFQFPGRNFLSLRGKNLYDILIPGKSSLPILLSGMKCVFLPCSNTPCEKLHTQNASDNHIKSKVDILLIRIMIDMEEKASVILPNPIYFESERFKQVGFFPSGSTSKEIITRQDLPTNTTLSFLDRFAKTSMSMEPLVPSLHNTSAGSSKIILAEPAGLVSDATKKTPDFSIAWKNETEVRNPVETASSLLFYEATGMASFASSYANKGTHSSGIEGEIGVSNDLPDGVIPLRLSQYHRKEICKSKNSLVDNIIWDGNQGCEGLVYFPPLFPLYLQGLIQTREDVKNPINQTSKERTSILPLNDGIGKRKDRGIAPDPKDQHSAKRMRPEINRPSTVEVIGNAEELRNRIFTKNSIELGDLKKRDACAKIEDKEFGRDAAFGLYHVKDDFGLPGIGTIPSLKESAIVAAKTFIEVNSSMLDPDQQLINSDLPSDMFVTGLPSSALISLDSMILFVARKKQYRGGFSGLPNISTQLNRNSKASIGNGDIGRGSALSSFSGTSFPGGNDMFHEMNAGFISGKKGKKKGQQVVSSLSTSAFSRIPTSDYAHTSSISSIVAAGRPLTQTLGTTSMSQFSKIKEVQKNRALSSFSSRQKIIGSTLYETPGYRLAEVRLRKKLAHQLTLLCWTSKTYHNTGPGMPLILANQPPRFVRQHQLQRAQGACIPFAERLKTQTSATMNDATRLASGQRAALRRSLTAPCRVDFGPFQSGFLSSPSGMTGISPPRSRVGVSLPMGVKVPQASHEQQQNPWSSTDDRKLQECAVRYGMNWIFAARSLSGYEDVALPSKRSSNKSYNKSSFPSDVDKFTVVGPYLRSARHCRERWQTLAQTDPSLVKEVRKSERELRDSARMEVGLISWAACERGRRASGSTDCEKNKKKDIPKISPKFRLASVMKSDPVLALHPSFLLPDANNTFLNSCFNNSRSRNPKEDSHFTTDTRKQDCATKKEDTELLCSMPRKENVQSSSSDQGPSKRSFLSISNAKIKKEVIPMTIPGVIAGSPPSLVPPHPSHMQSVQTSIAASWSTSGRTEMWPLQILDVSDKQREATAMNVLSNSTKTTSTATTSRSQSVISTKASAGGSINRSHHHLSKASSTSRSVVATGVSQSISSSRGSRLGYPQSSQPGNTVGKRLTSAVITSRVGSSPSQNRTSLPRPSPKVASTAPNKYKHQQQHHNHLQHRAQVSHLQPKHPRKHLPPLAAHSPLKVGKSKIATTSLPVTTTTSCVVSTGEKNFVGQSSKVSSAAAKTATITTNMKEKRSKQQPPQPLAPS